MGLPIVGERLVLKLPAPFPVRDEVLDKQIEQLPAGPVEA